MMADRALRILVVDDESLIAMALHDQLEYLGHEVVGTASTGPEAIALADLHLPDLLLMDVHLGGGMDGLEVAERINAARPTPTVILTGFPDKMLIERGRKCNVVAHLLKPIDIDDLRQAVDSGWAAFKGELPDRH
jgi:CheY-like chemotaxis protein